ncbi:MAG: flagellar hook assembly protein FlgD [Alphaproteobacteria bacterium]
MTDISALTGSTPDSGTARRSLADNFDNFLSMLTTQLQNQDPLSPMDSTEFTNQLVQFTSLEQQIAGNDKLDDLYAASRSLEAATAVQYLGQTVELDKNVTFLNDGAATISYILPTEASEATINIYDQSGKLVRTLEADTSSGRTDMDWNGTDTQGLQLTDGTYTIAVSARTSEDEPMDSIRVYATGTVDEVITDNGQTFILVNDVLTAISDVKSVIAQAN